MRKGLSFLIILALIATGLGFTSPELQNKEIDFGNDIKYIDGVVDLDFSEEGNFIKSEEVQLEFKNFVINKAQIRIIGDVDYGGESYKLNIKGKMGKSNTEEGVICKVEDLSGNFEVIHLSFISVSNDLQSILHRENAIGEKVLRLYLLRNDTREFVILEKIVDDVKGNKKVIDSLNIDNDDLIIFTDEEIYTEEFWYNKVISPTEDLEEALNTNDLESNYLDTYDSTEISLASSGGPTRYRTEVRRDPSSASMERWYRYSRSYTFKYMWGYGMYTSTETHWIHIYTMVGHSIPGANWSEATVKIHSKAITGGTYPGERNISANNLRLGSSSDPVLIVPNLTNQSFPHFSMKFTGRSSEHYQATRINWGISSVLSTVSIATAPLGTKGAILSALVQGTDLVVRNLSTSSSNTSWANISDPNVKSLPTSFDRQYLEKINSQFSVKSRTSPPLEAHKSSSIYSAFIHIPIYHGSTKVSEIEFHDGLPAFPTDSYYRVY